MTLTAYAELRGFLWPYPRKSVTEGSVNLRTISRSLT